MSAHLLAPAALALVALTVAASLPARLRPRATAWLLATSITLVFASVVASAWVLSLGLLSGVPAVHRLLTWCLHPMSDAGTPARMIGAVSLALATLATVRLGHVAAGWHRRRSNPGASVRVVDDERALAYVEAGPHGSIVVSTAMLGALRPLERRAMLAHETAHVRHRHDRFLAVGRLTAGVPLLSRAGHQLHFALERWADEEAVRSVGDRSVVAHAVARASLTAAGHTPAELGMAAGDVVGRVEALLADPNAGARSHRTGLVVAFASAGAAALTQLHHLPLLLHAIC